MSDSPKENGPAEQPRRNFLAEASALIVGGVMTLVGLVSGLIVFLDPLLRKQEVPLAYRIPGGAGEGFIKICSLDAVPKDGLPRRFPVITDQIDAWNFTPNQPIGAIYLRRTADGSLQVFHATCPHAGCSVAPSADNKAYLCPCHNSSFDLDGEKINSPHKENPSPRSLDSLEYDEEKLAAGEIWVKYVDYYTGIHERKAKI